MLKGTVNRLKPKPMYKQIEINRKFHYRHENPIFLIILLRLFPA